MGETCVDLLHLLEDLRDAYSGSLEETIVTEIVASSLDSGAGEIVAWTDPVDGTLTVSDDGTGMSRQALPRHHGRDQQAQGAEHRLRGRRHQARPARLRRGSHGATIGNPKAHPP